MLLELVTIILIEIILWGVIGSLGASIRYLFFRLIGRKQSFAEVRGSSEEWRKGKQIPGSNGCINLIVGFFAIGAIVWFLFCYL